WPAVGGITKRQICNCSRYGTDRYCLPIVVGKSQRQTLAFNRPLHITEIERNFRLGFATYQNATYASEASQADKATRSGGIDTHFAVVDRASTPFRWPGT